MDDDRPSGISGPSLDWSTLPHVVLDQIFKELETKDRFNASLVCRTWADAFHSPCLWRKLSVDCRDENKKDFKEQERSMGRCLKVAKHFGEYVHDLEVKFAFLGFSSRDGRAREINLEELIKILSENESGELQAFRLHELNLNAVVEGSQNEKIIDLLSSFLESQHKLRTFTMDRCFADLSDGLSLLEHLLLGNKSNLRYLTVQNFFQWKANELNSERYREVMTSFDNIVGMELSYRSLDQDLLKDIIRNYYRTLISLTIHRDAPDENCDHLITSEFWSWARNQCPMLKVHFNAFATVPALQLFPIGMPLHSFTYVDIATGRLIMKRLFNHLRQHFAIRLETLHITTLMEHAYEGLFELVQSCSSLKTFDFIGTGLWILNTISEICKLKTSGQQLKSLKRCTLSLCGHLSESECETVRKLQQQMAPQFSALGSKLEITIKRY